MPLDQVWVVIRERAEEPRGIFDETGEQHHAEAEGGRGHGRGIVLDEQGLDGVPV